MSTHIIHPPPSAITNSNHSSGPTSIAGKAISSRNATKHGCCSDTLILPHENLADFELLEQTWLSRYQPEDEAARHLIGQLIEADWFFQRATRTVADVEAKLFAATPNPLDWTEAQQKTLARFLRYQTTRANLLAKARKSLDGYRKLCTSEVHAEERIQIARTRLEIYKEKNKPKLTWQQELAILQANHAAKIAAENQDPD